MGTQTINNVHYGYHIFFLYIYIYILIYIYSYLYIYTPYSLLPIDFILGIPYWLFILNLSCLLKNQQSCYEDAMVAKERLEKAHSEQGGTKQK